LGGGKVKSKLFFRQQALFIGGNVMQKYVLALDQGTSSLKAVLVDGNGKIVAAL